MKPFFRLAALLLLVCAGSLAAQDKKPELTKEQVLQLVDHLKWHTEPIPVANGRVTLHLAPGYRFLDSNDTGKVMNDLWRNLPSPTLGMIFPNDTSPLNARWAVLIKSFEDEGYVKDDDAAQLDNDKLLKDLQENQKAANEELAKQGLPQLEILGWASKPNYDREAKKLTWAIDLRQVGSTQHGVNYYVRVLGRQGFMVIKLLGGREDMAEMEAAMPKVLSMVNFNEGQRYADFNPKTDKVAAYGIAGLIAAGVGLKLLKVGFFALIFKKLVVVLAAGWKFILAGCAAIAAWFKKMFAGKKAADTPPQ